MGATVADNNWQEDISESNLRRSTDHPDADGNHLRQRRQRGALSSSSDCTEYSIRTGSTQPEDEQCQDSSNDRESWGDSLTLDGAWSLQSIPQSSLSVEPIQPRKQSAYPNQDQYLSLVYEAPIQSSLIARSNGKSAQTQETMSDDCCGPFELSREQNHVLAKTGLGDSGELLQDIINETRLTASALALQQSPSPPMLVPREMSLPSPLKRPPLPSKPSQSRPDLTWPTKAQSNHQLSLPVTDPQEQQYQNSTIPQEKHKPLLPPKQKKSHLKYVPQTNEDFPPARPPKPMQTQVLPAEPTQNSQPPLLPPKPADRNDHKRKPIPRNDHRQKPVPRNDQPKLPSRNEQQQTPASRNVDQRNQAPRNIDQRNLASRDIDQRNQASRDIDQRNQASRDIDQRNQASRDIDQRNLASRDVDQRNLASRDVDQRNLASRNEQQRNPTPPILPRILPRIPIPSQLPIIQPHTETQISCSVSQQRHQGTPTVSTSSEERTESSASGTPHSLKSYTNTSTQHLRRSERRPHCLISKRCLLITSFASIFLSLTAMSFLTCVQFNIFNFTWRDLTFREGTYKTCVKCLSLIQDLSADLSNPEFQNLVNEPRDGEMYCCALNSQQMSSLFKLALRQQEYNPSYSVLSESSVVPSAHRQLLLSDARSNIIGDGHTIMAINEHETHFQHKKKVTVDKYGLKIETSGYYYVYSSICYSNCPTGDSKHFEHTIFLVRPTNTNDSGFLVKTAYTCRQGDKQSSFAGGVFKLMERDQIAVSVTNRELGRPAVKFDDSSYLGVVMLGTWASDE